MSLGEKRAVIQALLGRGSVSAKRLVAPGPSDDQLRLIVEAALTAPDHGHLTPWRFIVIPDSQRGALAELFVEAARRAEPDSPKAHDKARDKAMFAPTLIGVVARLAPDHPKIPLREQYISVGGAVGYMLVAAEALGFGAILLSGARTRDPVFAAALGIEPPEELIGFVSIGTPAREDKPKTRPPVAAHLAFWQGPRP